MSTFTVYHKPPAIASPHKSVSTLPERAVEALQTAILDTGAVVSYRRLGLYHDIDALDRAKEAEHGADIPPADG